MLKKDLEALVDMYAQKDALNKKLNGMVWNDPFTSEPECNANARYKIIDQIKQLELEISVKNYRGLAHSLNVPSY